MKKLRYRTRVLLLALWIALPALGTAAVLLFHDQALEDRTRWTLLAFLLVNGVLTAVSLAEAVDRPLQTAVNLLAALREDDFSVRGRGARAGDGLGELLLEINQFGDTLDRQHLGAIEAGALLRRVMDEIEVAVIAFDTSDRAVLANRSAERLLGVPLSRLLEAGGLEARKLKLDGVLREEGPRLVELDLPGGAGRFEVKSSVFRLGGMPHRLLVLADLRRALREEERLAWQRLVRVLGHEINNSLTPIHSISGALRKSLASTSSADVDSGLLVIERRAESLMRFMGAYARLARLPAPQPAPVEVSAWIARVVALERRVPVKICQGPAAVIEADADQLDQLLINLVRNAADAALATSGAVEVAWSLGPRTLEVTVLDEGPGIANPANLFVPFFTTKPEGTGVGLLLSRQIAEGHDGALSLENRSDRTGARARLTLPLRRGSS